jgi:Response regulator containing a CheY-like receiver domain and an HTH DNA-binding domain
MQSFEQERQSAPVMRGIVWPQGLRAMKAKPKEPARILIADDHPIIRSGLARLIGTQKICAAAEKPPMGLRRATG